MNAGQTLLLALLGVVALTLLVLALVPVALVIGGVLLVESAVGWFARARSGAATLPTRNATSASVMILNWSGRAFLERLLPSVDAAIAAHKSAVPGSAHEVIVIDNGSTDDSVTFVQTQFPHVRLVRHARNEKFVRGYNLALSAAQHDIVVVLNNDMVVDRDVLIHLLAAMAAQPSAFAVSARIVMQDADKKGMETGRTAATWSLGMLKLLHLPLPEDATGVWPCLWAGGGSSAIDRRALLAHGGFEALFDPYYYEDASLGYQAWKRGELVLLAPQAKVVHSHRGSSSRLRPWHLERVQRRNAYVFMWRSFDDVRWSLAAASALPLTAARAALRQGFARAARGAGIEAAAIGSGLLRLPAALRARAASRQIARRSDREVMRTAHSRHRLARAQGCRPAANGRLRLLMLLARVPRRDADGSWVQFELLRRLGARHHVTVFALAESHAVAERARDLAPHVARIETMVLTREAARVDLWRQDPPGLRRDYSDAGIRARVRELLASEAFDVVQVDYVEMAYVVEGLLTQTTAVHVVHEPLATAGWIPRGGGLRAAHERARAVNLERRLLRDFARIVCMAEQDAATLRACHPHLAPHVINNGIDLAQYQTNDPEAAGAPTMLFVGSFTHDPNVEGAVFAAREVLPRVLRQRPDARLLIAGHDPQKRLRDLRHLPGVDVLGFVDDLSATVRAAGCFLAPLLSGAGMRSKTLQALAWGKAVVGTPLAFTGIAGKPGMHYLMGSDADALAAACVRALSDADLRRALGQAGRRLIETEHDADAMANAYEAVYRELLAHEVAS